MATSAEARLVQRFPEQPIPERLPHQLPYSRLDVRLLEAVARGCDLAEVARGLRLRHGAAERHLDRLDRAAGVPLTLRNRHTAQLTSAGFRMLSAGRRFFSQVDLALRASLHGHGNDARESPGVLAIATSDPVIEDLVEDIAAELDVLLAVSHGAPDQLVLQLDAYRVDAVHTWWFGDPRTGIDRAARVHPVLDEPLWALLPRTHPLAGRDTVSLAELTADSWVSELGPGSEVEVSTVYRAAGLPAPGRIEVTSASVLRGMLCRGEVVGLGSPVSPHGDRATPGPLVSRPIAERPMRTRGLLVDPSAVPQLVGDHLARLITAHHLTLVAQQHGPILSDPWWAAWYRRQTDRLTGAVADQQEPASAAAEVQALDVEEFHLLRAVAEHGSINRAATVLSISQPALTRRVHRLEGRLGVRLLLRTSRGTTLTGPARQFLDQLTALETEFLEVGLAPRAAIRTRRPLCVRAVPDSGRPPRSRSL